MEITRRDLGKIDTGVSKTISQRTLKSAIDCTGVALHSGAKVRMTLIPAEPDTGIVFKRTDITKGNPIVPATWDRVVDTRLCSMLGNEDGVTIGTVEHLMAALAGSRIDNLIVALDGPEVPVMDGSAEPFMFLIECAGVVEQNAPRRAIRILKSVTTGEGACRASLSPGHGFSVSFDIEFSSRAIAEQTLSVGLVNGAFKKELSRARTFGFLHEVEQMRAAGLARGGSLENAIVIDGDTVMNQEGLRYDDEFVRHKSLDAVGDLYLAGLPIIGHFHGVCSGHAANNALLKALFADPTAWRIETLRADEAAVAEVMGGSDHLALAASA